MLEILEHSSFFRLFLISIVINTLIYFFSILLYILCTKIFSRKQLQNESQPILKKDILLSLRIVYFNSIVLLVGVFLWKNHHITLSENHHSYTILFDVLLLLFAMDFLMYCFHKAVHFATIYRWIHKRHHLHQSTNAISLFVLHPLEALGFGALLLLVISLHCFSVESISIYLFINLLWGTIGHLNVDIFPEKFSKNKVFKFIGTSEFHNIHHLFPHYNLGFYSKIWDNLFGTLSPFSLDEINENKGYYFPPSLKLFIQELKQNSEKFGTNEFEYHGALLSLEDWATVTFKGQEAAFTNWNFDNETFIFLVKVGILKCTKEFTFDDWKSNYKILEE